MTKETEFRYVVQTCHQGSDLMVRRARQDEIDDPNDEVWNTNEEALKAAHETAREWGCRVFNYGDEPPCENCGPNGTETDCPDCMAYLDRGCGHGDRCKPCSVEAFNERLQSLRTEGASLDELRAYADRFIAQHEKGDSE